MNKTHEIIDVPFISSARSMRVPSRSGQAHCALHLNYRIHTDAIKENLSNYYPDFFVKLSKNRIVIVETKGREDLDVPLKMERLRQW